MKDVIPEGLERFVNVYGENASEFTEKYGAYQTPPRNYTQSNTKEIKKQDG